MPSYLALSHCTNQCWLFINKPLRNISKCKMNVPRIAIRTINNTSNSGVSKWKCKFHHQGLALLTLSWDKNWDNHSLVNGYPSFYPRIALVAPSPGLGIEPPQNKGKWQKFLFYNYQNSTLIVEGIDMLSSIPYTPFFAILSIYSFNNIFQVKVSDACM